MVQQVVEKGCDEGYMNLKESLYAHCIIAGHPLPELETWKRELEEKELQRAKRTSLFTNAPQIHAANVGRNDPCPCGSGKKYKKCCGSN
jgi:preprotein translocase subunit SecA